MTCPPPVPVTGWEIEPALSTLGAVAVVVAVVAVGFALLMWIDRWR